MISESITYDNFTLELNSFCCLHYPFIKCYHQIEPKENYIDLFSCIVSSSIKCPPNKNSNNKGTSTSKTVTSKKQSSFTLSPSSKTPSVTKLPPFFLIALSATLTSENTNKPTKMLAAAVESVLIGQKDSREGDSLLKNSVSGRSLLKVTTNI